MKLKFSALLDCKFLTRTRKKIIKYSVTITTVCIAILYYKLCREIYKACEPVEWETVIYKLESILYDLMAFFDNIDGWSVFYIFSITFVVTLIICRSLEKRILKMGGSLDNDGDSVFQED